MTRPILTQPALHGNAVARAIEKQKLNAWLKEANQQADTFKTGDDAKQYIVNSMHILGRAMRTIYGWEDEDCIGDAMADAVLALEYMTHKGYQWDEAGSKLVKEAQSFAVQILTGMDAKGRVTAELWARGVAAANPYRDLLKEAA